MSTEFAYPCKRAEFFWNFNHHPHDSSKNDLLRGPLKQLLMVGTGRGQSVVRATFCNAIEECGTKKSRSWESNTWFRSQGILHKHVAQPGRLGHPVVPFYPGRVPLLK